jgi:hypothetical protein
MHCHRVISKEAKHTNKEAHKANTATIHQPDVSLHQRGRSPEVIVKVASEQCSVLGRLLGALLGLDACCCCILLLLLLLIFIVIFTYELLQELLLALQQQQQHDHPRQAAFLAGVQRCMYACSQA